MSHELFFVKFQLSSRNSSPDNDFVDVEGTERPHSSASASSQKFDGLSTLPLLPEIKRGRGRPRKNRDNLEEGKFFCDYCRVFFYIFIQWNAFKVSIYLNSLFEIGHGRTFKKFYYMHGNIIGDWS